MEQILNYRDMSEEQRALALNSLSSIGFYPAYGKIKTMQRVMDKSIDGERPQFYFAFRNSELIGYMFLIRDAQKFRSFPWIEINNLDELPMNLTEQLMKIAIDTYRSAGAVQIHTGCRRYNDGKKPSMSWEEFIRHCETNKIDEIDEI